MIIDRNVNYGSLEDDELRLVILNAISGTLSKLFVARYRLAHPRTPEFQEQTPAITVTNRLKKLQVDLTTSRPSKSRMIEMLKSLFNFLMRSGLVDLLRDAFDKIFADLIFLLEQLCRPPVSHEAGDDSLPAPILDVEYEDDDGPQLGF
jgi:hypothetical protein